MDNETDTKDTIREILAELKGKPVVVADDQSIMMDGLIDSLSVLEMIMAIEERFEVEFEDDDLEMENFETIECIAALIKAKR